jgi:hypothetical protein
MRSRNIILCIALSLLLRQGASASSWGPTLLVNTESFQIIDDGDGTTDIELRFGDSVNEKIYWDKANALFRFSDDLHADGNLTASGTLTIEGATRLKGATTITNTLDTTGAITTDADLTINEDNGATDATITFGNDAATETLKFSDTSNAFEFSDDVNATGNFAGSGTLTIEGIATLNGATTINSTLDATGNITTDGTLQINDDDTGSATLTFGNDAGDETIIFNDSTNEFDISDDVNVTGTFDTTGNITTDANLTINEDNGGADAVFTFGNDAGAETITFSDTSNKFELSDDLAVQGNLSGSTLTIDGNVNLRSVTYSFPTSQGGSNTFLKNDGSGNLSWAATTVSNSSGSIISLSPEYPNAVYFGSGSSKVGVLSASGGIADGNDNYYVWASSKATLQDYWISTRIRVPDTFSVWDPVKALQFRYKTGNASAAVNHMTIRLIDTAGSEVALTGGGGLASTSWATANITGPESSGTYTAGEYVTILVKLSTTSSGTAKAGFLELNWETVIP